MSEPQTASLPNKAGPEATDTRLLLLSESDNVFVVTARIRAGEIVTVAGSGVAVPADLPIGHKVARQNIQVGEKVVKYGAPIGSATAAVAKGAHVHVHNVKSDYTPTYHLDDARERYEKGT